MADAHTMASDPQRCGGRPGEPNARHIYYANGRVMDYGPWHRHGLGESSLDFTHDWCSGCPDCAPEKFCACGKELVIYSDVRSTNALRHIYPHADGSPLTDACKEKPELATYESAAKELLEYIDALCAVQWPEDEILRCVAGKLSLLFPEPSHDDR